MSHINIEPPPEELSPEVKDYITRQFVNVNIALSQSQHLDPITILPYKPQNGDTFIFSAPVLPLIEESGYYGFYEGSYYRLDNIPETNELPPLTEIPENPVPGGLYYFEVAILPDIPFPGYYGYDGEVPIYLGPALIPNDILPIEPIIGGMYYFDKVIDPEISTIGYWGFTTDGWISLNASTPEKAYGGLLFHEAAVTDLVSNVEYEVESFDTAMVNEPKNIVQNISGNYLEVEVDGVYQLSAKLVLTSAITSTSDRRCFLVVNNITTNVAYSPNVAIMNANNTALTITIPALLMDAKKGDRFKLTYGNGDAFQTVTLWDTEFSLLLVS